MASTLKVLEVGRARIKRGWHQGWFTRFEEGKPVAWCATGAINNDSRAKALLNTATGSTFLACWNDEKGRTKRQVLAAFDKAIRLARKS